MNAANIADWLGRYGDPAGENKQHPAALLDPVDSPAAIELLVTQAAAQGVIMAAYRNVSAAAKKSPAQLVSGDGAAALAAAGMLVERLEEAFLAHLAQNMVLAELSRELAAQIAKRSLPACIIKGVDFAETAYGGIQTRAFSDVDILTDPRALPELAEILECEGFKAVQPSDKRIEYTERQFGRPRANGDHDLVEVHTDLVHAPKLRKSMSMTYRNYTNPGMGGVSMGSRLILAGLHGATSHLFDRLQYVTDMLMIARAGVDAVELGERIVHAGAQTPLRTGLRLAHAIFGSAECAMLLAHVPPRPGDAMMGWFVDAQSVFQAQSSQRRRYSWRRQAYRWMLARQAPALQL